MTFDPKYLRENRSKPNVETTREMATSDFGSPYWCSELGDVVLAHILRVVDDPEWHVAELLETSVEQLSKHLVAPGDDVVADPHFNASRAFEALAIGRWIQSGGEAQPETFARAFECRLRYEETKRQKKKASMQYEIYPVMRLACAAGRIDEGAAYLQRRVPDKTFTPSKARNAAEYLLALQGMSEPSPELGSRYLRAGLTKPLSGGRYIEGAVRFYLASLSGLAGSPQELLGSVEQHISYLRAKKKKKGKPTRYSEMTRHSAPALALSEPRPPRAIPTSLPPLRDGYCVWHAVGARWAVNTSRYTEEDGALFDQRAGQIVEWQAHRRLGWPGKVHSIGALTSLRRASVDGEMLSLWAENDAPLPLEVANAPTASHDWNGGRWTSLPSKLSRTKWKAAMKVGALTSLRALSLSGIETDRERAKRGDAPYLPLPIWFVKSPLAGQLEALELRVPPHDLANTLELFDALPNLQELMLWLRVGWRATPPECLHIQRSGAMRIQSASSPASEDWDRVFDVLLSEPALARLGEVDVSMLSQGDEPSIRAHLGKRLSVGTVAMRQPYLEF